MAAHSSLTGANLHEPKGAASAGDKEFYVTDGLGSGAWTDFPTGWGSYVDASTTQTFGTTESKLIIDSDAGTTSEAYLPQAIRGSGSLWDGTNDCLTPVAIGDAYDIRLNLPITGKTGTPTLLTLRLDIGGLAAASIVVLEGSVAAAKTPPYTISSNFHIFCLATFLANGGQFFVSTDSGTVDVDLPSILIIRTHGEV